MLNLKPCPSSPLSLSQGGYSAGGRGSSVGGGPWGTGRKRPRLHISASAIHSFIHSAPIFSGLFWG